MKLVKVRWTDAHNNNGLWHTKEELTEFVNTNLFIVEQVGWLAHEDDECICLAARLAKNADQYGMVERIPKRMIEEVIELA